MVFLLSPRERAQKYWAGFLYKTVVECERKFKWLNFKLKGNYLEGKGSLIVNNNDYHFTVIWSPLLNGRFERVTVETKNLIKSFDTHFNADGSLCLYHPFLDLKGRPYIDLVDIIPWVVEWAHYYDYYSNFKVWLGPEHPHYIK